MLICIAVVAGIWLGKLQESIKRLNNKSVIFMDKIALQPISHFKKGDAFVEKAPHPLVFMEVNEVEGDAGNKDFGIVQGI